MTYIYRVAETYRESGKWYEVYRLKFPNAPDTRENRVTRYRTKSRYLAVRAAAAANGGAV